MAATAAAAKLTDAHRAIQLRLAAVTVRELLTVWPLLDVEDLDRTFERWTRAVAPIVNRQRATSAEVAARYVRAFRTAEIGVDGPAMRAAPLPTQQLVTSLLVTGPASIRARLAGGMAFEKAVDNARAGSAQAAMRHVLNGGRQTITTTVEQDDRALGWARVTSGKACAFCSMLASRGPIYKSQSAQFQAHDHCHCGAEPVYRSDAAWPKGSAELRDLWEQSTGGLAGDDARKAFADALGAR